MSQAQRHFTHECEVSFTLDDQRETNFTLGGKG